jgi:hypothetical protein
MTDSRPTMTLALLDNLSDLLTACRRNASVRWLDADGETVRAGVMRHFVKGEYDGSFLLAADDVRDAFVRITEMSGAETFLPAVKFAEWLSMGYVAFDS